MQRSTLLLAAALAGALAGCAPPAAGPAPQAQARTLKPFASDEDYVRFHRQLVREYERMLEDAPPPPPPPPPPPAPPPPPSAAGAPSPPAPALARESIEAAPAAGAESITNVQHAGVDEGGIVKVHGDHLVILRRGRLFTVRVGGDTLQPVAAVDAYAPGLDPSTAWYDEMLISGDNVVVIGFNYMHGTEIGLFRIGADGSLAHRATYHMRSTDYYASRNYASRLIGDRLIYYNTLELDAEDGDPFGSFPALRRWGTADTTFHRTATGRRIYRPAGALSFGDESVVLHAVTSCTLADDGMSCESTALLGPEGRVFYVSPSAVYVWATQWPSWDEEDEDVPPRSVLYRVPLNGSAPTGIRVEGAPVDQLSFLESADGHINVLTAADAAGESMWDSESADGALSLLRLPVSALGDGKRMAPRSAYRPLPSDTLAEGSLHNRFLGDWLLYGREDGDSAVYAVRWADGGGMTRATLPHGVERIEAMGRGAVVIGTGGGALHFSGFRLGADSLRFADRYTHPAERQGETRSHGFFYRQDAEEAGVLGLPIHKPGRPRSRLLETGSASILFLRNQAFRFAEMGRLEARGTAVDDGCRASCVDWYGDARPIFLRGRVFALLGYEIVEGSEDAGRIRERRRVSFAPARR